MSNSDENGLQSRLQSAWKNLNDRSPSESKNSSKSSNGSASPAASTTSSDMPTFKDVRYGRVAVATYRNLVRNSFLKADTEERW